MSPHWNFNDILTTMRPTYGNNFRSKFLYLEWNIAVGFFGYKIQKNPLFPPSDMYGDNEDLLGKYLKKSPHQREKISRTVFIEHNTFRMPV